MCLSIFLCNIFEHIVCSVLFFATKHMHLCVNLHLYMHVCVHARVCVCVCVFFVFVFVCVSKFVCAQLADHQVSPRVRVEMMWAFEIVAPDKNYIYCG